MYLTTLDLTKYTALGSADYPAYTLYNSIVEVIRHRISPATATLLAEPIFDDNSQKIDYIVAAEGELRTLGSLNVEEANLILDKLTTYSSEIRTLADSYIKSNDHHAKRIGQTLRNALYVPDTKDIYVVEGQPVLTGWGLKHRVGGAPFDISLAQSLKVSLAPSAPAPPAVEVATPEQAETVAKSQATPYMWQQEAAYAEAKRKPFPWLYVLLAIPCLLILLLLLRWLFSVDRIASPVTSTPSISEQSAANKPATATDTTTTTAPAPDNASTALSSSQQSRGTDTSLVERASALTEEYPADTSVLVIPKRSIETGDVGFLYGEWASVTDLISAVSKEPLTILYTFDLDGSGTTTIIREASQQCVAPVKAEFISDGRLYIKDQTDVLCDDGVYFPKSSVICEGAENGQAVCQGQQTDNQYNVTLKRSGKRLSTFERLEQEL